MNNNIFYKIIKTIAQKAEENVVISDGDYIKDGLLYCGKCHTPKQQRVEIGGIEYKPPGACDCERPKLEAEEKLIKKQFYDEETERMRNEAFPIPGNDMKNWTFKNDNGSNADISKKAKDYAENFENMYDEGLGFLFFGNVGAGKSYIAASIANAVVEFHHSVIMTNFARIRNEIQGTSEKQAYFDELNSYSLLILDDLLAESDTEYMKEVVFQVIDNRLSIKKPMIITTNLTKKELANPGTVKYQRLFSRMMEYCVPIEFKGSDQRATNAARSAEKMRKILGK